MTEDEQIQVIEEWFKSLHVTLWGQYDVVQDDSRRLAATWFLRQMQALTKFIEPQDGQ
jgi:molybdopterin biosynthesis enzyme MoaB